MSDDTNTNETNRYLGTGAIVLLVIALLIIACGSVVLYFSAIEVVQFFERLYETAAQNVR